MEKEHFCQEIERMKTMFGSEKIFLQSLMEHFKNIKQLQAEEIQDLKRQVEHLNKSIDQFEHEKKLPFNDSNVNIILFPFIYSKQQHNNFHLEPSQT